MKFKDFEKLIRHSRYYDKKIFTRKSIKRYLAIIKNIRGADKYQVKHVIDLLESIQTVDPRQSPINRLSDDKKSG